MVEVGEVEEPLPSEKPPFLYYSILLHPNPPYVGTSIVMLVIVYVQLFLFISYIYTYSKREQNFIFGVLSQFSPGYVDGTQNSGSNEM